MAFSLNIHQLWPRICLQQSGCCWPVYCTSLLPEQTFDPLADGLMASEPEPVKLIACFRTLKRTLKLFAQLFTSTRNARFYCSHGYFQCLRDLFIAESFNISQNHGNTEIEFQFSQRGNDHSTLFRRECLLFG